MDLAVTIFNMILMLAITLGAYKNKVDYSINSLKRVSDIDSRLIRLEEKVNWIYETIKNKYEGAN